MPIISALGRQEEENPKFKANLGYIVYSISKKNKKI
jgi:hypothetical protein